MLLVLAVCGGMFNMYETRAHAHTDKIQSLKRFRGSGSVYHHIYRHLYSFLEL